MSKKEDLVAIKRVQNKSSWDSKKFYRLKSIDCFPEVHKLLASGYHPSKVAAMIQNQYGEYKEIQQRSLEKLLKSYYETEISSAEKVANQLPEKFDETVRDLEETVNVIQEIGSLFKIQKSRIEMAVKTEEANSTLLKNTGREIKIAADLLKTLNEFQHANGMAPDDVRSLHNEASMALNVQKLSGISGRFLMDPSSRNSVIGFLEVLGTADPRIVQAAIMSKTIDVEPDEGE